MKATTSTDTGPTPWPEAARNAPPTNDWPPVGRKCPDGAWMLHAAKFR
jgi:hypothetical protein